jgi:hypothetical protein
VASEKFGLGIGRAGDVAPIDREVAETEKGSALAEVLIILGVEGLALCRHPPVSQTRRIKGRLYLRGLLRLTIANVVEWKTTELRITSSEWVAPVLAGITDCKAKGTSRARCC